MAEAAERKARARGREAQAVCDRQREIPADLPPSPARATWLDQLGQVASPSPGWSRCPSRVPRGVGPAPSPAALASPTTSTPGPRTSPEPSGSRTEAAPRHPRRAVVARRRSEPSGDRARGDCGFCGAAVQRRHPARGFDQGLARQARGRRGVGRGAACRGLLAAADLYRARGRLSPPPLCGAERQASPRPLRSPPRRSGDQRGGARRHPRPRRRRAWGADAVVTLALAFAAYLSSFSASFASSTTEASSNWTGAAGADPTTGEALRVCDLVQNDQRSQPEADAVDRFLVWPGRDPSTGEPR
jgi:hypothetical protein